MYRAWVPEGAAAWAPEGDARRDSWLRTPVGWLPPGAFPTSRGGRAHVSARSRWQLLQMRAAAAGGLECPFTGARIDSLGEEPHPALYIEHLVALLRSVRSLLRPTAVMWLVMGDSYYRGGKGDNLDGKLGYLGAGLRCSAACREDSWVRHKQLLLIPGRLAAALQEDGWLLRNDAVWKKDNPMPSSARDKLAPCHENVFLFSVRDRYWFDLNAIRKPPKSYRRPGDLQRDYGAQGHRLRPLDPQVHCPLGKNPGDVFGAVAESNPYKHVATYPRRLVLPMLLAGCPLAVCPRCGEPWNHDIRVEQGTPAEDYRGQATKDYAAAGAQDPSEVKRRVLAAMARVVVDNRWTPACSCGGQLTPVPGLVFDPFAGSATTTQVAAQLGLRSVGIELNPEYVAVMQHRFRHERVRFTDLEFVYLDERTGDLPAGLWAPG